MNIFTGNLLKVSIEVKISFDKYWINKNKAIRFLVVRRNASKARPLVRKWNRTFQKGITKNAGRLTNVMANTFYRTIHQTLLADTCTFDSYKRDDKYTGLNFDGKNFQNGVPRNVGWLINVMSKSVGRVHNWTDTLDLTTFV